MGNLEAFTNPYLGPRTFTAADAHLFFGREREARDLYDTLVFFDLVLFYAQSGAGKSSLINTRLIPLLQGDGFEVLPIGRVAGEIPAGVADINNIYVYSLILSLGGNREDPGRFTNMSLADFLHHMATDDVSRMSETGEAPHQALIIDQFEEIFTTHVERWQERADFFRQLGQAMNENAYLHILLAMREDYVAALDPYAPLVPGRLRTRFYMQRMGVNAALEAISKPAALGGRPFAPGVAEKLVDDLRQIRVLGQSGTVLGPDVEPVQLQVNCYQLWENLNNSQPADLITDEDLASAGDVNQALTQFYENSLHAALSAPGIRDVSDGQLRLWFDQRLITEAGTRGLLFLGEQETAGLPNAVVSVLQRRFLVRAETRSGGTWIELVHDRLVEPIRTSNRIWFAQNAQNMSALQRQADLWLQQSRPDGLLLTSETLTEAKSWAATHQNELSAVELEFLSRSQEARARAELERWQNRRVRTLAIIAVAVAITSLISAAVAVWALVTR